MQLLQRTSTTTTDSFPRESTGQLDVSFARTRERGIDGKLLCPDELLISKGLKEIERDRTTRFLRREMTRNIVQSVIDKHVSRRFYVEVINEAIN